MRISDWSSDVCSSDLAVAGEDEALVIAVLLVVIESQSRLDAETAADLPAKLTEQREAGVLQILGVDRGQPVEHRRVLRQRVRRIDRPAARCRAMPFGTLRVDPLIEGEAPEHEVVAPAEIGRASCRERVCQSV